MTNPTELLKFPESLVILSGDSLVGKHHLPAPPSLGIIIRDPLNLKHLRSLLLATYPSDHPLSLISTNESGSSQTKTITLAEFSAESMPANLKAIQVPPLPENRTFEFFQHVVAALRAPDGCPWDRKQTHQTLRDDFLQEVYELLDALDRLDLDSISEELGDVLLHVVIQAQIAQESGEFNMGDVLSHISEKLIFRHEHVFAKAQKLSPEEVIDRWEKMKKRERELNNTKRGMLDGISKAMPALSMAFSYQKRAARAGFDWDTVEGVWEKLSEEIEEFRSAQTPEQCADELGDILFTLVNLARWSKIDPETALRMANIRFFERVSYVEERANELGKDLLEMPLSEKDRFWEEYKGSHPA